MAVSYAERTVAGTRLVLWRTVAGSTSAVVLPDGHLDLMWFRSGFVLAGPDITTRRFGVSDGEITWGLRLPPGHAHCLLGVAADELVNQRVPLADVIGGAADWTDLRGRPPAAGLLSVHRDLALRAGPDPLTLRRARLIDSAARQGLSCGSVADQFGASERTVRRFSQRVFGYGVKTLGAIHRLHRALDIGRSGAGWADAAATAGYADHAHLVRDCRRLTGMTPGAICRD